MRGKQVAKQLCRAFQSRAENLQCTGSGSRRHGGDLRSACRTRWAGAGGAAGGAHPEQLAPRHPIALAPGDKRRRQVKSRPRHGQRKISARATAGGRSGCQQRPHQPGAISLASLNKSSGELHGQADGQTVQSTSEK